MQKQKIKCRNTLIFILDMVIICYCTLMRGSEKLVCPDCVINLKSIQKYTRTKKPFKRIRIQSRSQIHFINDHILSPLSLRGHNLRLPTYQPSLSPSHVEATINRPNASPSTPRICHPERSLRLILRRPLNVLLCLYSLLVTCCD